MNWKPSKRQAQLKQRLIDSSRVYWNTSRKLDQMLLKMLHSNNVYTPDDFYHKFINHDRQDEKSLPVKSEPRKGIIRNGNATQQIDRALSDLDSALVQLRYVINGRHSSTR